MPHVFRCSCDSFLCDSGGGDEDDPSQPCTGTRLELFQTEEDYCGWCSSACVEMLQVDIRRHLDILQLSCYRRERGAS